MELKRQNAWMTWIQLEVERVSADNRTLSPRKQLLNAITDKQLNTSFCCGNWQMRWYIIAPITPPIPATCMIEDSPIDSTTSRNPMSLPVNQGESSYLSTSFSRRFACDITLKQRGPAPKCGPAPRFGNCIWSKSKSIPICSWSTVNRVVRHAGGRRSFKSEKRRVKLVSNVLISRCSTHNHA